MYEAVHCTNDFLRIMILIDGKKAAADLRAELKKEVAELALSHKDSIMGENVTINEAGSWRVPNGFVGVELSFHFHKCLSWFRWQPWFFCH